MFLSHLLALNAVIEVVRAGDAVKGFVVVTDEIRNHVNGSIKAPKEIVEIINKTTGLSTLTVDNISKVNKLVKDR
ncbi:methyl-accepting chemotaxis protein [Lacrimispora sp.]|uniref:methyl-accepting chemotaxis protein n=1 Tax=Lacrimispora sp. TaxID=2719234 RepID=UPI0028AF7FFC|nr:methyl-accepting chemotaxis protein [Lacrimispora sp.]